MKTFRIAILAGLLLGPLRVQDAGARTEAVGKCTVEDDRLILHGQISAEFKPCVMDFVSRGGRQIEVDLYGGDVLTAIAISDVIHAAKPTLFVARNCNSSCANYLIPVADRIVFGSRSLVVTHGSPADVSGFEVEKFLTETIRKHLVDGQPLAENKQAQLVQQGLEQAKGVIRRHEDFVRKHGVPSGYFGGGANVVWTASELQRCFPNIMIEQPVIDKKGTERDLRKFRQATYVYGSADDRCRL